MKLRAFSLIELLIGVALISLVFLGLVEACFLTFKALRYVEDVHTSQLRAERVFALLRMPFDHCGYGMPKDSEGYRRGFGSLNCEPFNWNGPLSIETAMFDSTARENGECRIVFGIRTRERVTESLRASSDTFSVETSGNPHLSECPSAGQKPLSIKNWLLFGSMLPNASPLSQRVLSGNSTSLELKAYVPPSVMGKIFIPENDEIFYLRAFKCRVKRSHQDDFAFYINDQSGSGEQPRVDGIVDARFEYNPTKRMVTVLLLAKGENRYGEIITKGSVESWPDEYTGDIPEDARHYRLFAYKSQFGLKNF